MVACLSGRAGGLNVARLLACMKVISWGLLCGMVKLLHR